MILSDKKWKIWNNQKNKITQYDPPQLKPNYINDIFIDNNCVQHNSTNKFRCCYDKVIDVKCDADIFLNKLLENENKNCPDFLKGVWWMKDNIINERFITFSDANWNNNYAIKYMKNNWTQDNTCQGSILSCLLGCIPLKMELEYLDNWISIKYASTTAWMYIIDEDIKYTNDWWEPELRNTIVGQKGDLMRITYENNLDINSKIKYQYILKKVAYKNNSGNLIKTKNWGEYLSRCDLKKHKNVFKPENSQQIIR